MFFIKQDRESSSKENHGSLHSIRNEGTMTKELKTNYESSINKVLNYIHENLSTPMELNHLAQIGCCSPFHFHRLFKAYTGESIGSYIKRKRLEQAAHLLSYSGDSISDIGYHVGYETPSSLSAAFQKHFGCSPSHFRKNVEQFNQSIQMKNNSIPDINLPFEIKQIDTINVAFVRCKGYNPDTIGKAWKTIIPFAKENGFLNQNSKFIGISVDNPDVTQEENCEYNACINLPNPIQAKGEISTKTLKGGKYAVFLHKGPYDHVDQVYAYIFKKWLVESEYNLRDGDVYDNYLNSITNTAPEDLLTEIHIPIQ